MEYNIRLGIPSVRYVAELTVLEIPMQGQNLDYLIGRDLLSRAVLVYQGFENTFTLGF